MRRDFSSDAQAVRQRVQLALAANRTRAGR